ncbi:LysR family transcriptional regulator [Beijerinckia indica]|uniref:Transcriptional regulator, LysR family n=1 Tax=Beijerinckia indica subsp. indica (strain ATCC 9039 / DSM 1715 / NCIMB 8712) TaxID=395963 RepID=B2IFL8_BEII9|nr:LysR family transcriptional regulator [Beijerinckia indica]ACB94229.1 transcriptional regulator, LysR family [Beijerinckia indica subsp. indica ATCC 9039]
MDDISLSHIFLVCADEGSFSAAGRKLNLSRSSVGKTVARLEDMLGVRLFHRSTRHQALTEEGKIYYEHARRAHNELDRARQIFASGHRSPSGILRVTAPMSLGRSCIGPLLLDFTSRFSDLKLVLSLNDRPVDLIDEGFDLAIRVGATINTTGIAGRKLSTQAMRLYASPSYLGARGTPKSCGEFDQHQILAYGRGRTLRWRFAGVGGQALQDVEGMSQAQFDDLDLLANATAQGFGIASLPTWLAHPRALRGELVPLKAFNLKPYDISALWPQSHFMPPKVRYAIDHLVQALPGLLTDDLKGH